MTLDVPPRAWQSACLLEWEKNGRRGVARVATGAGKTYLGLMAARALLDRLPENTLRVRIVTPTLFLAAQWRADILAARVGAKDVGLYNGQVKEGPDKPFMIYVVNTARRCLARHILNDFQKNLNVFLICDECHHMGGSENAKVFEFYPSAPPERYFAMGLSATPEPPSGMLPAALGGEIYRYDTADALRDGVVPEYFLFSIALRFTPEEEADFEEYTVRIARFRARLLAACPRLRDLKGAAFFRALRELSARPDAAGLAALSLSAAYRGRREISHMAAARPACAEALLASLLPERRVIVFAERIESVNLLYNSLTPLWPGRVGRYHSDMPPPAKQAALERFRSGEYAALLCCRALDEGLNVPAADAGILLSSTGSERQHIQRLGRVLRLHGGQKALYYLHIPKSGEPAIRLPAETAFCRLSYDPAGGFTHPAYDALAALARSRMTAKGISQKQLAAADRRFAMGQTRPDFLLPPQECRRRAQDAPAAWKDYWICMALIAREREKQE